MSVLVVIFRQAEAEALTRWGWRFARASKRDLVVLWAEKGAKAGRPTSIPMEDSQHPSRSLPGLAEIFEALEAPEPPEQGDSEEAMEVEVKHLIHADLTRGVLREIERSDSRLLVLGQRSDGRGRPDGSGIVRRLFRRAPCAVLLLRLGAAPGDSCKRILVASAGGEHSRQALRLAGQCAEAEGGTVVPLLVEPDANEFAQELGDRILLRYIAEAGLQDQGDIEPRVEVAASLSAAVARVAAEGFDLVLMGASRAGAVGRKLFGIVPDRLIARQGGMTVGLMRAARPASSWLRRSLEGLLDLSVPQMEREERVALVENLQLQSRWSFDFLALIALSTAIASLGLLQDSAAVVIGAMLVAPLMTPLLGAGLALVQGNLPLMRTAAQAIVLGFLTALAIGDVLGSLVPIPSLSSELAARGQPTLLDLGVAFLSGVAAAYCVGRPNLSAALPGVAIAAALVPPIATIGISLALGDTDIARGSAILFGTNVVAVIMGAATSFFGAGIRANRSLERGNRWARTGLVVLVLLLLALAVPLASLLVAQISRGALAPQEVSLGLREALVQRLAEEPGMELERVSFSRHGAKGVVEVHVSSPRVLGERLVRDLAALAASRLGRDLEVRVRTELVRTVTATSGGVGKDP